MPLLENISNKKALLLIYCTVRRTVSICSCALAASGSWFVHDDRPGGLRLCCALQPFCTRLRLAWPGPIAHPVRSITSHTCGHHRQGLLRSTRWKLRISKAKVVGKGKKSGEERSAISSEKKRKETNEACSARTV